MRLKYFFTGLSLVLGLLVVTAQPSHAQTSTGCVPSGGVCAQVHTTLWEYDRARNVCYQPFAQCGGTQFATQADCELSCLVQNSQSPTITPTPAPADLTPSPTPTAGPSEDPDPSPTLPLTPSTEPEVSPTPSVEPTCANRDGDANDDNMTNLADFEIFRQEFAGELTTTNSDFNCDNQITLADFEVFRSVFVGNTL